MNFKNAQLKKVLTGLVVFNLVFGPASTALALATPTGWGETSDSQTLLWSGDNSGWTVTNETSNLISTGNSLNLSGSGDWSGENWNGYNANDLVSPSADSLYGTGNSTNLVEDPNGAGGDRAQKDSQSDEQAAKDLEQQQKKDTEECNKQGGSLSGATNAISQAAQPAVEKAIQETIQQGIKESIPKVIKSGIEESVPKIIKSSLQSELPTLIKTQLPTNLQSRLTLEKAAGTDLSNNTILSTIVQDEIKKVISNGIPSILNKSLSNNLPSALNQYLQNNLSNLISSNISTNLPANIQGQLGQALSNSNLGDQIDSSLRTALEESGSSLNEQIISSIDISAFNQISDELTNALTANMDSITEAVTTGLADNLTSTLDTLTQGITANLTNTITDSLLAPIDSMVNQLTSSLTDPINQALNGLTSQLNGTINGMMDQIMTPINDMMSGMMDQIMTPINDMMSGMMDTIMSPINDMMSGMMDTIMSPINDMMSGMMDTIMSPVTGMLNNVTSGIANTIGSTVGNTVGSAVGNTVGSAVGNTVGSTVGNTVGNTLGGAVGGIAGGAVAGIIGGGFVPVKEQNGPLLKATKNIDTTTGDIKKLTVEICKHTKTLQRIQQKFEQKEFSDDPSARAQARTGLVDYAVNTKNEYLDKGYAVDASGAKAPLYVTNLPNHLAQQAKEASQVAAEDIKNSGNNDAEAINRAIAQDRKPDVEMLKSTISKETRDKMINDPASMSAGEGWSAFMQTAEPENNFRGSYLLALDLLGQRESAAAGAARDEYIAADGFLPTRECVKKTEDGSACIEWGNTVPGSINKTTADNIMAVRQDLYTQAKNKDEVAKGNEPQVKDVATFQPSSGSGGWTGSGGKGSGSGGRGGLDLSSIMNLLQGQGGGNISDLLSRLTNPGSDTTATKPVVSISLTKNSASNASLKWSATSGATCKASNDWYSLGGSGEIQIVKAKGETLSAGSGSINISIPIPTVTTKLIIRQYALNYELGTTVRPSANGLVKETIFAVADDTTYHPQISDIYTLTVGDQSVSFTNNSNIVSTGITGLKEAVGKIDPNSAIGKKFSQVKLSFDSAGGKITASTALKYKITCTNSAGTTDAEANN